MRRQSGFTLIELLIVIAIIGILAAVAIPNLLNAVQRGKQKRTMADMRVLATVIESFQADTSSYPTAACDPSAFTQPGTPLTTASFTSLVPTYLSQLPMNDGWGHFFVYNLDNANPRYNIISYGRNGVSDGGTCGTTGSFNDDIVFSNGTFLQWPDGPQN